MTHPFPSVRKDFPILKQTVHGKPLVYLDNAATMQKPQQVIDAITEVYTHYNSNIHRGIHHLSNVCTSRFEAVRETVQQFIQAQHAHEIIFTRGTTESINLVAQSFGRTFFKPGDEVIISAMEHHSNIVPWQLLKNELAIQLKVIPISDAGELDMVTYEKMLSPQVKMVSVTHVSNALGTINPVKEIIRLAHNMDVPVMLDGAQAAHHLPVNVQELDCDFYAFSGHKLYGPTGIGVLYGKEKWLKDMRPYQGGGEMIKTVSFERTTFNELPFKFEAGTPNYADTIGLGAAINYLLQFQWGDILAYEKDLLDYATSSLQTIDGLKIYGEAATKSSVISFLVDNIHPYDMGMMLDKMGIAVRTGHHCAQPVMDRFNIPGTLRASFALYNTREEIDILAEGIRKVKQLFA
jgi:cysteine desulfurase/selenocysteine lyase